MAAELLRTLAVARGPGSGRHIIRSEKSLNKIREYILNNPLRWEFDRENPAGQMDKVEQDFWKGMG